MQKKHMGLVALAGGMAMLSTGAHAFTLLGSKWEPGPNNATFVASEFPSPGSATWSIMGSGIGMDPSDGHGGATTTAFGSLIGGATTVEEAAALDWALNTWASVCAFTNLGMVADGGGIGGAPGAASRTGDIRFGAIRIDGAFGVLAHAFQPFTEAHFSNGTFGGDTHFDNAEVWADDPTDTNSDGDFDFHTVALHEIGHALGLGHSGVVGSVMEPFYGGARRTLHADDIAGIQAIYGVVPEPATMAVLGLGALGLIRRRRAK